MLGSSIFSTGVHLALPLMTLLFLIDLSIGLLGHLNAQLQLIALAFPAKMLTALAALSFLVLLIPKLYRATRSRGFHRARAAVGTLIGNRNESIGRKDRTGNTAAADQSAQRGPVCRLARFRQRIAIHRLRAADRPDRSVSAGDFERSNPWAVHGGFSRRSGSRHSDRDSARSPLARALSAGLCERHPDAHRGRVSTQFHRLLLQPLRA